MPRVQYTVQLTTSNIGLPANGAMTAVQYTVQLTTSNILINFFLRTALVQYTVQLTTSNIRLMLSSDKYALYNILFN